MKPRTLEPSMETNLLLMLKGSPAWVMLNFFGELGEVIPRLLELHLLEACFLFSSEGTSAS